MKYDTCDSAINVRADFTLAMNNGYAENAEILEYIGSQVTADYLPPSSPENYDLANGGTTVSNSGDGDVGLRARRKELPDARGHYQEWMWGLTLYTFTRYFSGRWPVLENEERWGPFMCGQCYSITKKIRRGFS